MEEQSAVEEYMLPSNLKQSLNKISQFDTHLKKRYDRIYMKDKLYGNDRPKGSYMNPKVGDLPKQKIPFTL